jgi:ubiquinone/menaquinone biosynthesis C-methylase UbiE
MVGSSRSGEGRGLGRARFEAEFGIYSLWLAEACDALQVDPVPALARGTGRPALLELAAASLRAERETTVLDVGCGLGGPGTWLARKTGARVVGLDVMLESVTAIRRLKLPIDALVASLKRIPFRDASFDAAWSLGVLEMVTEKERALDEIRRVLRPGAPLVVYDFVLAHPSTRSFPQADRFSSAQSAVASITGAGFQLKESFLMPQLPPTPREWAEVRDRVRAEVERRHGEDVRFRIVQKELEMFRELVAEETIEAWMFVAEKEGE